MRRMLLPEAESVSFQASRFRGCRGFLSFSGQKALAIPAVALALIAAQTRLPAQTTDPQAPTPASTPAHKPVHRKRPSPAHQLTPPAAPVDPVPLTPPEPEQPKWPAFDPAAQASVVWNSQGLRIDAANSSLQQILRDLATATGAKVDGLTTDQRVFGAYGPGQARDVLSQLLQGSGYNVIMIGDQGQGMPRQILLSLRQAPTNQPGARPTPTPSNDDENDVEDQPANPEPVAPARPGFPPGAPPRSPQQIMQEMQQRQQQQQQQPQPNNPQ